MVLPEVEQRRSGEVDVAEIASTRRARREGHGQIWTPRRHFLERITCLREREGPTLPNLNLPSRDLDARQVKRRGERSRRGGHEIRGTVVTILKIWR